MKERGMLFSASMALAVLRERDPKTVTRRVVKLREFKRTETKGYAWTFRDRRGRWQDVRTEDLLRRWCPYGVAGQRLWMRETFAAVDHPDGGDRHICVYRASCDDNSFDFVHDDGSVASLAIRRWTPAIHMPRKYSRATFEVVSVRVERVHDITEEDARAEGVFFDGSWWRAGTHPVKGTPQCWPTARRGFEQLWKQINGEDSWAANPWVWRIEFRRVNADSAPAVPTPDTINVSSVGGTP